MIRRGIVATLVMVVGGVVAHWNDLLHLVAGGLTVAILLLGALAILALRRRSVPEEASSDLAEEEPGLASSFLRDGVVGVSIGGLGILLTSLIYAYALPPFYPFLVGDCPQILPKLALYEETGAWPRAVALIDARLSQPIDKGCRAQLAERKCRYLIEWSKVLPREQADRKLQEAERWAQDNQLPNYQEIARLRREQLRPTFTPPPVLVTPTPSPRPTPRSLPVGTTVQLSGLDMAYFPPTIFLYLQVLDGSGQPITGLGPSDVRVLADGQSVDGVAFSYFSQAPAPISAAIVMDYSGSMEGTPLESAKAGARTFLSLLAPDDQVEVIGFNDRAQLLQAWTGDRQAASEALNLWQARDHTALWDALWLAASDLAGRSGRKVVVLLTDGADNRSQHSQEEVIAQARRAGLSLFVIGLRTGEYNGAGLQALVQAAGGHYAEADNPGELEKCYRQMAGAIRSEYRLTLNLPRQPEGGIHRLRVEIGGPQPLVAEQTYQDPSR